MRNVTLVLEVNMRRVASPIKLEVGKRYEWPVRDREPGKYIVTKQPFLVVREITFEEWRTRPETVDDWPYYYELVTD